MEGAPGGLTGRLQPLVLEGSSSSLSACPPPPNPTASPAVKKSAGSVKPVMYNPGSSWGRGEKRNMIIMEVVADHQVLINLLLTFE